MGILTILPIIKPIVEKALSVVDQLVEDKDKANAIKAELERQITTMDYSYLTEWMKAQKDVLMAELQGDSWLGKNWRPMLMCLFGIIIANNYIINPYTSAMFGIDVKMVIPEQMWDLLKIGVGGYIVGRSAEKAIERWKK